MSSFQMPAKPGAGHFIGKARRFGPLPPFPSKQTLSHIYLIRLDFCPGCRQELACDNRDSDGLRRFPSSFAARLRRRGDLVCLAR